MGLLVRALTTAVIGSVQTHRHTHRSHVQVLAYVQAQV